jgi:hypothetical protein
MERATREREEGLESGTIARRLAAEKAGTSTA